MPDVAKGLNGVERAAVLLLALGEEAAGLVMRNLGPKDVQRIGVAMAGLTDVSAEAVDAVLSDFGHAIGRSTALGIDSEGYLRSALVQALGEERAASVIERILLSGKPQGIETLKWMDGRAVFEMVRFEHPQIIAIILSHLDDDQAAEVLGYLPERVRNDVVMRVATLDMVQPAALAELNRVLEERASGGAGMQSASVGGPKRAADILNLVGTQIEAEILSAVRDVDEELGQQIQDQMFVFENLGGLEGPSIQILLREVSSENLILALKGADEALREKFFANMSKRAAEMMRDDLDAKGPVRVSEVEAAQKEIVGIARRLADEGQIALSGKGGDDYI